MTRFKLLSAVLAVAAAMILIPAANAAPIVHVVATGSSAQYQGWGVSVIDDVAPLTTTFKGGGSIHHFTIKGGCADGVGKNCVSLVDSRSASIQDEQATYWVAWVCASAACTGSDASDIWIYNQVDSCVGARTYLAVTSGGTNSVSSQVAPGTELGGTQVDHAIDNIDSRLLSYGVANGLGNSNCHGSTCDDSYLPTDVFNAVSDVTVQTGVNDVTPADCEADTNRALGAGPNQASTYWNSLGYQGAVNPLIGAPVKSGISTSTNVANPVAFGLPGTADPISGGTVPASIITIPLGEAPIIFVANRKNSSGLGSPGAAPFAITNVNTGSPSAIGQLFGGTNCTTGSSAFGSQAFGTNPIHLWLREPMSGTFVTTEHSAFYLFGPTANSASWDDIATANRTSQEANINVAPNGTGADNPLVAKPCTTGGDRTRGIGTGEVMNGVGSSGGVLNTTDGMGYTFFSFGNVSKMAKSVSYGYLTINNVDPIFSSYNSGAPGQPGNGELPGCTPGTCNTNSIWGVGAQSYPNLRNGTYQAWSIYRAECLPGDHCTISDDAFGTEGVIETTQDDFLNATSTTAVVDYLPFSNDGTDTADGCTKGTPCFGPVKFVREHFAFSGPGSSVAPNRYPQEFVAGGAGYSLSTTFPVIGSVANLANGILPGSACAEVGGDAGGAIIATNNTGAVIQVTSVVYPAVNSIHLNFKYNLVCGTAPQGVCTGAGTSDGTPCDASTAAQCGSTPGAACSPSGVCTNATNDGTPCLLGSSGAQFSCTGGGATCTPNPMQLAVSGTSSVDDGVWLVTKIPAPGSLKVKSPASVGKALSSAPKGSAGSVSNGAHQ